MDGMQQLPERLWEMRGGRAILCILFLHSLSPIARDSGWLNSEAWGYRCTENCLQGNSMKQDRTGKVEGGSEDTKRGPANGYYNFPTVTDGEK